MFVITRTDWMHRDTFIIAFFNALRLSKRLVLNNIQKGAEIMDQSKATLRSKLLTQVSSTEARRDLIKSWTITIFEDIKCMRCFSNS